MTPLAKCQRKVVYTLPVTEAKVRYLVAGFSPKRPGFEPSVLHTDFVVDKTTQTQDPLMWGGGGQWHR